MQCSAVQCSAPYHTKRPPHPNHPSRRKTKEDKFSDLAQTLQERRRNLGRKSVCVAGVWSAYDGDWSVGITGVMEGGKLCKMPKTRRWGGWGITICGREEEEEEGL